MLKIASADEMAFADRADVILVEVVQVFSAFRIPDHPIAIIASLTYCPVLSQAVMFKQVIP